jgi:membrane protease YdiL (CAAX protease family)
VSSLPLTGGSPFVLKRIISDIHFWVAVGAAVVFWSALALVVRPSPDWGWPLNQFRQFLYLVILYPVVEEIVFRGYLQGFLRRWGYGVREIGGITSANLITSLLFTGLHFVNHPPLAATGVFVPSLVFGYFRDRYDNIHASVILHMFYNLGYFWLFGSGA